MTLMEQEQKQKTAVAMWAAVTIIVYASLAAYLPAMTGGFLWDDKAHVTRPALRSLDGLGHIWLTVGATQQYYPLLHTAFWIQHKLWGDATLGYHVVNVALHIANASLLLVILRRLSVPGAALAAMVFALHPVHVESVAWITEQKNTLSTLFYLLAMLTYLRFRDDAAPTYRAATALFVAALLTKTVTATLPAALLVIAWWQRGRISWKRDVVPLLPWFVLGALAGVLTAWIERKLIGAEGAAFELSPIQRGLLAGRIVWFYLGKLLWPANLIFIYPRWEIRADDWQQWLYPAGAIAAVGVCWLVRHRSRAPLAAFLLFAGTLFPVLGFFNVYPFMYSFVADHFQYLASVAVIALICGGLSTAVRPVPRWGQWSAAAALLAVLFVLTLRQSWQYRNAETLYLATIQRNPTCWMAHNNLGLVYLDATNEPRKAIPCFERVLQIRPDSLNAWVNLTKSYAIVGRNADAIVAAEKALQLARAADDKATVRELETALKTLRGIRR